MEKKKIIAMLPLVGLLLASSCANQKSVSIIEGDKDPFKKYDEEVNVELVRIADSTIESTVLNYYPDETITNNRFTELYKNKLNLTISYKFIAANNEDYQNKINLAMTSNELPEFMIVDEKTAKELYDAECIVSLDDYWNDYASPYLKEITGNEELDSCTFDGKLYGIPQMYSTIDRTQFLYVRIDWIEKLNAKYPDLNLKEKPETIEDLEKIAKAFIELDPDGNSKNDTQGILLQGDIWSNLGGLVSIFNAYDAYPNIWVENENGKLEYGSTSQNCKKALEKLASWYKDGIISKEFVSQSSSTLASTLSQGKAGLFFCEQWGCNYPLQELYNIDDTCKWVALPIVSGTNSKAMSQADMGTYGWWVATNKCSRPEAIIKLMNVYLDSIWGENGDFEKYYMPSDTGAGVWKLSPVTPEPPTKNLDAYLKIKEAKENNSFDSLTGEAKQIYNQITSIKNGKGNLWSWDKGYNPDSDCVYESMNYYVTNNLIKYNEFVGAPTKTMASKITLISKEENKVFVNIITGSSDISAFDQFVQTFEKLGGKTITEEVNALRK